MDFSLKYHKAVKNDIKKIDKPSRARIKKVIKSRLLKAPLKCGEPLKGPLKRFIKLRIGDYRVIYKVDRSKIIILAIGNRKKIYDMINRRDML